MMPNHNGHDDMWRPLRQFVFYLAIVAAVLLGSLLLPPRVGAMDRIGVSFYFLVMLVPLSQVSTLRHTPDSTVSSLPRTVIVAQIAGATLMFLGRLCEVLYPASKATVDWASGMYFVGIVLFSFNTLRFASRSQPPVQRN